MRLWLIAVLFLVGCIPTREYSQPMTETAVVDDVIFAPRNHGSGAGFGMSMSGNIVMTTTSVTIPAKWAVVFRCQHGKFIIQGTRREHEALWKKMTRGQQVVVTYREVYEVSNGTRRLIDFDFLDAN